MDLINPYSEICTKVNCELVNSIWFRFVTRVTDMPRLGVVCKYFWSIHYSIIQVGNILSLYFLKLEI